MEAPEESLLVYLREEVDQHKARLELQYNAGREAGVEEHALYLPVICTFRCWNMA